MSNEQSGIAAINVTGEHIVKGAQSSTEQSKLADELKAMQWEPLLPVEKKLISWSIILGVVLLGILVWVSYTFFPGGH